MLTLNYFTGGILSKQQQRRGYQLWSLVHVLPGPNKRRVWKPSVALS